MGANTVSEHNKSRLDQARDKASIAKPISVIRFDDGSVGVYAAQSGRQLESLTLVTDEPQAKAMVTRMLRRYGKARHAR